MRAIVHHVRRRLPAIRYRRVGGLSFLRVGRVNFSWSVSRAVA